jgi:hypothetical protein
MVQECRTVYDAMLINARNAARLGLQDEDELILKNDWSEFRGKVYLAPVQPANLLVHCLEENMLLAGVQNHNTVVCLEKQN